MSSFPQQLKTGLHRADYPGGLIIVGVSGGPDSVALIHGLSSLAQQDTTLTLRLAHVDHGLREESASDAEWVGQLANALNVPCDIINVDIPSIAQESRIGIEEASRNARYDAFLRLADKHEAKFIAVGHHREDQVETVLHRIMRGTGVNGLAGIRMNRALQEARGDVRLIRPMLEIPKAAILAFLEENEHDFLTDRSNHDSQFTRNRIRNTLLPLLEADFNPRVREAIQRLAAQAAEVESLVRRQVAALLPTVVWQEDEAVRLRCDLLQNTDRVVVRELLVHIWTAQSWPRKRMKSDDWNALADLIAVPEGKRDLPGGIRAVRRKATLTLRPADH